MSKRLARMLRNQPQVKVQARAHNSDSERTTWLLLLGTAAAGMAYLFGFFFSFTGGCAPAGD
jgi:hypothetical protein